jgi:hypothetical protein
MSDNVHTVTLRQGNGEPATVHATVVTVERREEPSIFGGANVGLYAQLDVTVAPGQRPHTFILSRLVGEREWIVDAQFTANGFPVHSNGFGARYLRVRAVAEELGALLDQEARDRGVVDEIGPDLPLAFA